MRPLDCSRRSTNDLLGRHPASTGGADHAGAAAGVGGHAARLRREVGEGPLSSTSTESMVTRVALGGPSASLPTPSPRHLLPRIAQSPSTTLRTADGSGVRARTRERGALVQRSVPSRPACRPAPPPASSSPRLLRPGGRWVLEGAALLRVCAVGSPVRAGSSRPRPARARSTPPRLGVGALCFWERGSGPRARATRRPLIRVPTQCKALCRRHGRRA